MPSNFEDSIQKIVDKIVSEKLDEINRAREYPDYMDIGTAAKYLGISRTTFTQKILKQSNIPTTIIGGTITRFKKSDLDNYMHEKSI